MFDAVANDYFCSKMLLYNHVDITIKRKNRKENMILGSSLSEQGCNVNKLLKNQLKFNTKMGKIGNTVYIHFWKTS